MLSHRSIGVKLRVGVGLLAASTIVLFCAALYGLYAYRGLVKTLSARSAELPLANQLNQHVADLRVALGQARERSLALQKPAELTGPVLFLNENTDLVSAATEEPAGQDEEKQDNEKSLLGIELSLLRQQYGYDFKEFEATLDRYKRQLDANQANDSGRIGDDAAERATLFEIDRTVRRIRREKAKVSDELVLEETQAETDSLEAKTEELRALTAQLPGHLHKRLGELSGQVRSQYHAAMGLAWATFVSAILLLALATQVFRTAIAHPVSLLVEGARKVAAGDFAHRIALESRDEMGELAEAMNRMMASFQQTRDELDKQVRDRTNQVIRSEQLASVGFLAAGVAHEINNPLAAIAMCSESLESRVAELGDDDPSRAADWEVVRSYLATIGKESFRCKQITEKLLDFSRMGDRERRPTELRELVESVVDMVRHLGKYKDKEIAFEPGEPVIAEVDAQEMKQVLLNLVTNGLDSLDTGGRVTVTVGMADTPEGRRAQVVVRDTGCGMTDEVKKHLFEPFFTRRRGGQGTGLGLSITYRIVEEHHGELLVDSAGVGKGSAFTVSLPTEQPLGAIAA